MLHFVSSKAAFEKVNWTFFSFSLIDVSGVSREDAQGARASTSDKAQYSVLLNTASAPLPPPPLDTLNQCLT